MTSITAIILTKDESKNIKDCILSIKQIVERIVVVDSFSTDDTVDIARALGAEVFLHKFENHSKQYAFAVAKAKVTSVWTLRIDADERLTSDSRIELGKMCDENERTSATGIELRFKKSFLGRELYHGGVYPWRKLSCYKTGHGTVENRKMDEHILLDEGSVLRMKSDSLHLDYTNLSFFIDKHNWYSSKEAEDFFEEQTENRKVGGRTWFKMHVYYKLPRGLRAHAYYMYRYYLKCGFLDGEPGKIYAFLQAYWYRYLVDAKIYERKLQQKKYK